MQSNNKQWYIALDGGGTRTRAAICDASGEIAAFAAGDAGNPLSRPWEAVEGTVRQLIGELLQKASATADDVSALYLGLAGADRPEIKDRLTAAFAAEWGKRLVLDNDAVAALYAGTWGEPGVVLIAGTGSIAYAVTAKGERYRTGGWGYLLGDEGSGYDLGRRAAAAVMRATDGRGSQTALTALFLAHYGVQRPEELIARIYGANNPRKELADASVLVEKAAEAGDEAAAELIRQGAEELIALAEACLRKAASPVPVVLAGGLLSTDTRLRREVLHRARFFVTIPTVSPVVGALVAAIRATGKDVNAEIRHRLQRSETEQQKKRSEPCGGELSPT
ncbi:N-acetylglucosamine kinase [Brevibacillus sp. GCM10020057]|uniref:N-acetylglucosamine kinase n=1 Tax=Brevibacillus sp. GCM10020057 TaxID=3317327 RepID=UPI00362ECFC6